MCSLIRREKLRRCCLPSIRSLSLRTNTCTTFEMSCAIVAAYYALLYSLLFSLSLTHIHTRAPMHAYTKHSCEKKNKKRWIRLNGHKTFRDRQHRERVSVWVRNSTKTKRKIQIAFQYDTQIIAKKSEQERGKENHNEIQQRHRRRHQHLVLTCMCKNATCCWFNEINTHIDDDFFFQTFWQYTSLCWRTTVKTKQQRIASHLTFRLHNRWSAKLDAVDCEIFSKNPEKKFVHSKNDFLTVICCHSNRIANFSFFCVWKTYYAHVTAGCDAIIFCGVIDVLNRSFQHSSTARYVSTRTIRHHGKMHAHLLVCYVRSDLCTMIASYEFITNAGVS